MKSWALFVSIMLVLLCQAQIPNAWDQARVLKGAWGDGCGESAEGICELKCGKASKKGIAKVSLKITPFSGKKISYKSVSVPISNVGPVTVSWPKYSVTINEDGSFFGEPIYGDMRPCCMPNAVWSAVIGGSVNGNHCLWMPRWYDCYEDYYDEPDGTYGTEADFLYVTGLWQKYWGGMCVSAWDNCAMHPFQAAGTKWTFEHNKLDYWGEEYHYNANVPKVTYNQKTGMFKGSYKVTVGPYCMDTDGLRIRNKTYSLKLNGACVGGQFYGVMTYKKFSTPIFGE